MKTVFRGRNVRLASGPCALAKAGAHGRPWYRESGASVDAYAREHGLAPGRVADTLAILSPRVSVAQNVKLAHEWLSTGKIDKGVMRARVDALRAYEAGGGFTGPKVRAFAAALQGDPRGSVIDAWVYRAFSIAKPSPAAHAHCVRRLRATAARLGWPVAETQAAIWVATRAACGFADDYSPILMPTNGRNKS